MASTSGGRAPPGHLRPAPRAPAIPQSPWRRWRATAATAAMPAAPAAPRPTRPALPASGAGWGRAGGVQGAAGLWGRSPSLQAPRPPAARRPPLDHLPAVSSLLPLQQLLPGAAPARLLPAARGGAAGRQLLAAGGGGAGGGGARGAAPGAGAGLPARHWPLPHPCVHCRCVLAAGRPAGQQQRRTRLPGSQAGSPLPAPAEDPQPTPNRPRAPARLTLPAHPAHHLAAPTPPVCRAALERLLQLLRRRLPELQPIVHSQPGGAAAAATGAAAAAAAGAAASAAAAAQPLAQGIFHLSLSRTVALRREQIEPLVASLRRRLRCAGWCGRCLGAACRPPADVLPAPLPAVPRSQQAAGAL